MVKVTLVILSYNTKSFLKQCLASIFKSQDQKAKFKTLEVKIMIVDNGSTDGSREYLKRLASRNWEISSPSAREIKKPNLNFSSRQRANFSSDGKPERISQLLNFKVIFNGQNLGFAAGNNVGIREAIKDGADYVCLLNSDTTVLNRFWEPMIEFMEKNKKVGVVTTKIYFAPGYEFHKNRYKKSEKGKVVWAAGGEIDWRNVIGKNRGVDEVDKGQFEKPAEVDFVSGCCLLASSEVWKKAGFLDEKYFMYYEDADFCQRVKKLGFRVFYVPGGKIWHFNAGSSKVGGELQDYFLTRNRLLFGTRWAPWRTRLALFRESFRILRKGRGWQKIGVRDFYLRKFGKGSWK